MEIKNIKRYLIIVITCSFIYSFVRYFIFKEVSHTRIPLWIFNKASALSATILIVSSLFTTRHRKEIGLWGLLIGVLHSLMSVAMLNPAYYGKFYNGEEFTLFGELTMLTGVIAFMCLILAAFFSFVHNRNSRKHLRLSVQWAVIFNLLHLFFMGAKGWIDPGHWPAKLPPVSLVAAVFCVAGVMYPLYKKSKQKAKQKNKIESAAENS